MSGNDLLKAARKGNVEFLENCIASNKPTDYYMVIKVNKEGEIRNFVHVAVDNHKLDFVKYAIENLSRETILQVFEQPIGQNQTNHLHTAAADGDLGIIKVILEFYRPDLPAHDKRPWLAKDANGDTPCHEAIWFHHDECGLEIWKMDKEELSNTLLKDGTPMFPIVVKAGLDKWALEMLESPFEFSCTDTNGYTALHYVPYCSDERILIQLLERFPSLINQRAAKDGSSVPHYWAEQKRLWPFKCILINSNISSDVRKVFVDLLSTPDKKGFNPLHTLAAHKSSNDQDVEIAKLLIDICKQEVALEDKLPWLMEDKKGYTPLFHAIDCGNEKLAMCILTEVNNALLKTPNALILAIKEGCHEVTSKILDIVDAKKWTELLSNQQENALHFAPLCKRDVFERLLDQYSQLFEGLDKKRGTVLHAWVKLGEVWPFEYLLSSQEHHHMRSQLVNLIPARNVSQANPLHVAAKSTDKATYMISKLLVEAYKQDNPSWRNSSNSSLPWLSKNSSNLGPIHLAMCKQNEELALFFLSLYSKPISKLLDYYEPKHKTLFLAIEYYCFQVARELITKLDKRCWSEYVIDSSDGRTILHLAPYCKDREFGRWLVQQAPELITKTNNSGNTPLDEASDIGAAWIIQVMLEKNPSAFEVTPMAWVKACKNGHTSAVRVFIDSYPGKFSDHCIEHKDSPLHHIKLRNLTMYEDFLQLPRMNDLINVCDSQGATPLHNAIRTADIFLTESLLKMNKIKYNIKDHENVTARELLKQKCNEQRKWKQMCKSIGFDPTIKTKYFQHKENLLEVRNTLALVAALLATITFTAGFTMPGGFNQNTGEAMLAKKAAFIVFIISDTLAMCCSMLILIFLVWSMFHDPNKALVLIDRSMTLLLISIYFTLAAFMTGVFVVVYPKSLWVAILVLVMCVLVGSLANQHWLSKIEAILFSQANSDNPRDTMRQLEEGNPQAERQRLLPEESGSQGIELQEITSTS